MKTRVSLKYFLNDCRLTSFGLTQLSISVGRNYIIGCRYKLVTFKYMMHDVGLLALSDFKNLFLTSM